MIVYVTLIAAIGWGDSRVLHAVGLPPEAESASSEWVSPLGSKPLEGKLESIEGDKVRLSNLQGDPILLELWATWCLPCRAQAKIVDELSEEFSRRGIRVFSVNQGEERPLVEKFLADKPSRYPVILDRLHVVANQLEVGRLPTLVLLDQNGLVVAMHSGFAPRGNVLDMLSVLSEESE